MEVEYTRPYLYEKQFNAIFGENRYSVIEASTKSGKTHGCIVWLFEQALFAKPGQEFWWVAPIYKQAEIAYKRLEIALKEYGDLVKFNKKDLQITVRGAGVITCKTAENPDSLYGEDVWAAVMDEASRMLEAAWEAIRSTLTATRGKVRMIGNVKGRKNFFYKLCRMVEFGEFKDDPNWLYAKITAMDAAEAGVIDWEEIEDARKVYSEETFKELYLAEASEDGANPFGLKYIAEIQTPFLQDPTGNNLISWGWDLGKSNDYTVGIAINSNREVAAIHRWKGLNWSQTMNRIFSLSRGAPLLIDSTGLGDPILDQMQTIAPEFVKGFKFNLQSKQMLMEGLAVAIQHRNFVIPMSLENSKVLVDELESFEFSYSGRRQDRAIYSAPEGMHDDCVCALGLAVKQVWDYTVNEVKCYIPDYVSLAGGDLPSYDYLEAEFEDDLDGEDGDIQETALVPYSPDEQKAHDEIKWNVPIRAE